jgi:hypothetical protein
MWMKITLRINASETIRFQKNDIIYINEVVDRINPDNRIISLLTKEGIWFNFGMKIYNMGNAFTYLMHDEFPYILQPDWASISDKDKKLIKFINN